MGSGDPCQGASVSASTRNSQPQRRFRRRQRGSRLSCVGRRSEENIVLLATPDKPRLTDTCRLLSRFVVFCTPPWRMFEATSGTLAWPCSLFVATSDFTLRISDATMRRRETWKREDSRRTGQRSTGCCVTNIICVSVGTSSSRLRHRFTPLRHRFQRLRHERRTLLHHFASVCTEYRRLMTLMT